MGETGASFAFIISLANVLGLFPVTHKKVAGRKQLCFKWKSFLVIYCLIIGICISFVNLLLDIRLIIQEGSDFKKIARTIVCSSTFLDTLLFFVLAMQWPGIMTKWDKIDCIMSSYTFPRNRKLKLKLFTIFFCIAAFCEHVLYILYNNDRSKHSEISGFSELLSVTLAATSESLVSAFGYNKFLGVVYQFFTFQSAYCWSLIDLFIITVSFLLSTRFHQIAERLKLLLQYKIKYEFVWMEIRNHYDSLCKLCETLDFAVGNMILVSYLNTIIIAVFQLNSIIRCEENTHLITPVYLISSFTFAMLRALGVSHFAGTVYSAGKRVREHLNFIPHDVHNSEIDRFIRQVQSAQPALTGRQLFRVDDKLMFGVVQTILSYEIILMQFQIDTNYRVVYLTPNTTNVILQPVETN